MLDEIKLPQANSALSALQNLAGTRKVEIDLPILNVKAVVRPIDGSEELSLRTMKASGSTFINSFNDLILTHTTFEGVKFLDLEDFQKHLTPPDKSLLVYALLDSTFSELPEKVITCPECGTTDTHSPEPSALIHADTIPSVWKEKEDFDKFEIRSEIVPGFTVIYSMPTEADRVLILKQKENSKMRDSIEDNGDVLSSLELFCVYIKRLEIQNGEELITLSDKLIDIIPTVKQMPLDLQSKLLEDDSVMPLVEYTPNFYLDIECSNIHCAKRHFKWENINPEQDFFLKTLSVYN